MRRERERTASAAGVRVRVRFFVYIEDGYDPLDYNEIRSEPSI